MEVHRSHHLHHLHHHTTHPHSHSHPLEAAPVSLKRSYDEANGNSGGIRNTNNAPETRKNSNSSTTNGSTPPSANTSPSAVDDAPTPGACARNSPPVGAGAGVGGSPGLGAGGEGATASTVLPPASVFPSVFTDASGRLSRIPTISRKVRACAACKKQKIRCDFDGVHSTCVRCKKMKLECVVNRSLQTILDEDVQ